MNKPEMFPDFLYGTAWKEDRTQALVELALAKGFRGIDTANQRKHYVEQAVGAGLATTIKQGIVRRDDLFVQTKFTYQRGQDHRLPYDPHAPIVDQVDQSFAKSLKHLQLGHVDSYVLHGPSTANGIGPNDRAAWKAFENLHARGLTRHLGISNVSLNQLDQLCQGAAVLPTFVQNRCYANKGWDRAVRGYCRDNGIVYQGFSLLTANRAIFAMPALKVISRRYQRSPSQIIFRFALDVGMLPLTGTSNGDHMALDLAVEEFSLEDEDIHQIEGMLVSEEN